MTEIPVEVDAMLNVLARAIADAMKESWKDPDFNSELDKWDEEYEKQTGKKIRSE